MQELDQIIKKLYAEPDANIAFNTLNATIIRFTSMGLTDEARYLSEHVEKLADKAAKAGQNVRSATLLINNFIRSRVEERRIAEFKAQQEAA